MEVQRFEQAILKLAFETEARITTASVAYYLGIPSREANRLLNLLLEEGVLELDSDSEGNLFYRVPYHGEHHRVFSKETFERIQPGLQPDLLLAPPTNPAAPQPASTLHIPRLAEHQPPALPAPTRPHDHQANEPRIAFVHPNSAPDDLPAYTPQVISPHLLSPPSPQNSYHSPSVQHRTPDRPDQRYTASYGQDGDHAHAPISRDSSWHTSPAASQRYTHPQVQTHANVRENLFFGVTSRYAAPDASLDRCGASPIVLNVATRCEPQPLPESRPIVVSCTGYEHVTNTRDDYRFGFAGSTSALATIPNNDFLIENHIEQPEHQPGMALLLSLILCGTGQIYNGEVSKGIIMMVLCFLLWFVLLGWVVHIWSIVDAVVVAERINRKHN